MVIKFFSKKNILLPWSKTTLQIIYSDTVSTVLNVYSHCNSPTRIPDERDWLLAVTTHLNERNSVQCNDWNIIHRIGDRESLTQSKPVTCYITVMLQRESPWFLSDWNCRVISAYTQWMNGYIFTYSECDRENIPWISQYIHLQF